MAERASRLGLKLAAVPAAEDCKDQESKTARRKIQTGNQKIIERAEAQRGQQLKQWGGGEVSDEDSFEESTTPDGQVSGGEGTAADQSRARGGTVHFHSGMAASLLLALSHG